MKILFIHPNSWINEYFILKKLSEMGHEICVLEENRNKKSPVCHIEKFFKETNDNIETFWYNPKKGVKKFFTWTIDRFFKPYFNGRNLGHRMWIIWDAVRYFNPDAIICSEGFAYAIPAAFLKKLRLIKPLLLISYIGGDILDCPEAEVGKRRKSITKWLLKQTIKSADLLRAVSPFLENELIDFGANPDKIHIIPSHLSIDTEELSKILKYRRDIRQKIRNKYFINEDALILITLSNNEKGKGIQILASAWGEIINKVPNCYWLLGGPHSRWFKEQILPLISEYINKSIFLTGRLSRIEVYEHFVSADLHINPSLCEGLNMATVEAAAVGLPTISTNKAGIYYWIKKFNAGRVVSAGNSKELSDVIIESFKNYGIVRIWQKNCFALSKEFTLESVATRILKIMEDAL